ncbi:hypothetical protein [Streptomyces anandii]|uniref:Uncharacterized protein n=1 Tax=Streptomyces anandii TaxID=285454 RepID=A0ABW6H5Y7_9ACTN
MTERARRLRLGPLDEPSRYDVVVDEDVADGAVRLVAGLDSEADANTGSASSRGRRLRGAPAPS